MKYLFLFFLMIFLASCSSREANKKGIISIEDSIRKELNFNDSIKVVATKHYADSLHIYTFIDYNKNSKFHADLKKLRFTNYEDYDSSSFNSLFRSQLSDSSNYTKPTVPENLKKRWIPIYKYNGEFYVFQDCHFQISFEINDSLIYIHAMDGEYPRAIRNIELNKLYLYDNSTIHFKLVDSKRSIYKLKRNDGCAYFTTIENLNSFPIIVQHCHEEEESLIEFDIVKCE